MPPSTTAEYPGIDGFLGTRGSLMLDFVFVALFGIIPILAVSIYLVKYRRKYDLHKKIQLTLGAVLLVAVAAFEIDMQFLTKWEVRAEPSPFFDDWVWYSLYIHLFFAIPTALLWIFVIVQALRKFPSPPTPGQYSGTHIIWARLAAFELLMTAVTGWIFYWITFAMEKTPSPPVNL